MIVRMPKPVIAVLDPYHPDAIERLQNDEGIEVLFPKDQDEIYNRADAVMVRSETHLGSSEMEKFSKLRYIVKQGVGVDNIDLDAARKAEIEVYNTPGLNAEAVAELAFTLILCLARRVAEIDRAVRDGKTLIRSQMLGRSMFRKVLGIVGMGNIGLELARKWSGAMGGKVVAYDPYYKGKPWSSFIQGEAVQVASLEELLKISDVVSLHVPLVESTRNMIGERQFEQMKDQSFLLNCARGGIVNEEALARALQSGKLAGVGLDAMMIEPPTSKGYAHILKHENVILTPHIGASTIENQSRSGLTVVETVLDLLRGDTNNNRVA